MNLQNTNYKIFLSSMSIKMLNNLDWTSKLLPSKNEIHYHKGFERACLIEWE